MIFFFEQNIFLFFYLCEHESRSGRNGITWWRDLRLTNEYWVVPYLSSRKISSRRSSSNRYLIASSHYYAPLNAVPRVRILSSWCRWKGSLRTTQRQEQGQGQGRQPWRPSATTSTGSALMLRLFNDSFWKTSTSDSENALETLRNTFRRLLSWNNHSMSS